MQLLGNAAAIGGIVLGLMLAKSTIEGSLGSKVGGALKKFQNSAQKGAESRYKRSALGRGEAIRKQAKENYRTEKFARKLSRPGFNPTRLAAGGLTGLTSKLPGQAGARKQMSALTRAATAESRKAEEQELKDAAYLVESLNASELQNRIDSKSTPDAVKAASIARLTQIGSPKDYEKYVNQFGNDTSEKTRMVRHALASGLANNGQQFLKATDLDSIKNGGLGGATLSQIAGQNASSGVLSQEKMVSDNTSNLQYAYENADAAGKARMQETAAALLNNPQLSGKIKHNGDKIREIAGSGAPPTGGAGDGGRSHQELMERSRQLMGQGGTVPTAPAQGGTLNVPHGPTVATNPGAPTVSTNPGTSTVPTGPTVSISPDAATVPTGPTVPTTPATTRIAPQGGGGLPTTRTNPPRPDQGPGPTTPINPRS